MRLKNALNKFQADTFMVSLRKLKKIEKTGQTGHSFNATGKFLISMFQYSYGCVALEENKQRHNCWNKQGHKQCHMQGLIFQCQYFSTIIETLKGHKNTIGKTINKVINKAISKTISKATSKT